MATYFASTQAALSGVDSLATGQTVEINGRFAVVVGEGLNKTVRFPQQQSYAQTKISDGRNFNRATKGNSPVLTLKES